MLKRFKEEEAIVKENYLEGMVEMMDPKKQVSSGG